MGFPVLCTGNFVSFFQESGYFIKTRQSNERVCVATMLKQYVRHMRNSPYNADGGKTGYPRSGGVLRMDFP